jgi:hypothetical protein
MTGKKTLTYTLTHENREEGMFQGFYDVHLNGRWIGEVRRLTIGTYTRWTATQAGYKEPFRTSCRSRIGATRLLRPDLA